MYKEFFIKRTVIVKIFQQLLGKFGMFFGLIVAIVVFSTFSPYFFTLHNLRNILIQSGTIAIIAAGMTFVIIAGEIDLSVGSTLALSSVVGAQLMVSTGNIFLGVLATIILGTILGLFNGIFVAYVQLPSFIVTLASMWLFRGLSYVYTEGQAIVGLPKGFRNLASGNILNISNIVWLIILVYIVCHIVLAKLTIGRKIYATGDNKEAARLSGINIKGIKVLVFIISGLLASLGGVILMSRLNSGQPVAGITFELSAIAAAVIGGTSLTNSGVGGVKGTLFGALFISTMQNGLVILNVTSFWQQVLMGIVVLIAVGVDKYRKIFTE